MQTANEFDKSVDIRHRTQAMGAGALRIYEFVADGKTVYELFTLESLAEVLGLPMSTMNGRYARGQLRKWMQPIINGYGRPARGFHLYQLQHVIDIVTTKGTSVAHDSNGSGVARQRLTTQVRDLVPTYFQGKQYYTVPSLANAFGVSETTVRKKLEKAGLMRHFIDLGTSLYGGRPKRGIDAKHLGDVKMAVVHGYIYSNPAQREMAREERAEAQEEMVGRIVPHVAPRGMQSYDESARAPVATVNSVKSFDSDAVAADLMGELDAILNPAAPAGVDQSLYAASAQPVDAETAANLTAGRAFQLEALVNDPDEPTDEDLRDTTYSLSMSQGEADRFIAEVKAARAAKGA
jgi:hypothetical protein